MLPPDVRPIRHHSRPPVLLLLGVALLFTVGGLLARPARAEKWALLIGIDQYKDKNRINNLGAAAADARALKAALVEAAGFPEKNVHLLVSDADPARGESTPEYSAILHELALLANNVKTGDTVFVLYSGHGIETGGKTYLLPYDTDAYDQDTLTETAIDTDKFRQRLQAVHAGTLILAFDMCRTNPQKGAKGVAEPNKLTSGQMKGLDPKLLATGAASTGASPTVITLYACSPDQQSFEWNEKGRGYFSYFFEEGLRGEAADHGGTVRLGPLTEYVSVQVEKSVLSDQGKEQQPFCEYSGSASTVSDLVMATGVHPVAPPVVSTATDAVTVDTSATFRLIVSPTNAAISIDGAPQRSKAVTLDLGVDKTRTVAIHVEAPGCTPQDRQVTVSRGLNLPVVVMLDGSDAALSAASLPASVDAPSAAEDLTGQLRVSASGGAHAILQRDNDDGTSITVRITAPRGVTSPSTRVSYRTTRLWDKTDYEIRFRARADIPLDVGVFSQAASADQRNLGLKSVVHFETDWRVYSLKFHALGVSPIANFAPILDLGDYIGSIQISNLTLTPAGH